ncbi:MAG: hypothetical protein HOP28_12570, partial [Gemmatimonadales bacterium]|nr:hypothetical protein [Gemmatimonadales bacterium]
RTEPGYVFFTLSRYAICLIVMLPATFCAGMTLPLMTRMLMAGGSGEAAIGAIYGANTLGSIVGAAATGLLLIPLLGLRGSLVAGGALDMLLGIVAVYALTRAGRPAPRLAVAGFLVLLGLGVTTLLVMPWQQSLLASGVFRVGRVMDGTQRKMLFHADGRTATIHASQFIATGTKILSTNGKPDGSLTATWAERCDTVAPRRAFSGDDGTQAMLALLLLAHAPRARTGAVIGHGTGMSSHFLLGSPNLESLTTIEIEPAMLAGSRVFYPSNRRVFDDPRSRFAIEDAKSFFSAANAKFDLVLSEPSNPWVSGVSGLFTTEFYGQLRRYLAPGAVFGQWLHTYELSDGLVTGVLAALHENFADYRVFLINGGDLLVVGSPDRPLPPPDWSVTRSPAIGQDLCRFLPMTDAALDRMQVLDRKGLEPLMAAGGRANSDFYPSLDLGAERARFLQQSAVGIANLGSGVVGYIGNPVRAEPAFDTTTTSVLAPAPGVRAMLLAAELRKGGQDAAWSDAPGASERYLLRVWNRQMAGDMTPGNWRGWTNDFWTLRRALHGGAAPSDTAFFARAHTYAARAGAPAGTRAAIVLGEALARRELTSALAAADTLLIEAKAGRVWIPPDDLLDGTVRVFLAGGRPERARAAYDQMRSFSTRAAGDLRLALLNAYVDAAKAGTQ